MSLRAALRISLLLLLLLQSTSLTLATQHHHSASLGRHLNNSSDAVHRSKELLLHNTSMQDANSDTVLNSSRKQISLQRRRGDMRIKIETGNSATVLHSSTRLGSQETLASRDMKPSPTSILKQMSQYKVKIIERDQTTSKYERVAQNIVRSFCSLSQTSKDEEKSSSSSYALMAAASAISLAMTTAIGKAEVIHMTEAVVLSIGGIKYYHDVCNSVHFRNSKLIFNEAL